MMTKKKKMSIFVMIIIIGLISLLALYVSLTKDKFSPDYIASMTNFEEDGLVGVKNSQTGSVVIKALYEEIGEFNQSGIARMKKNGLYGFINLKGKVLVQPTYEDVGNFSDGLAYVKQADKYGYINGDGELLIVSDFDEAFDFLDGIAKVRKGDYYGYINTLGAPCFGGITYTKIDDEDRQMAILSRNDKRVGAVNLPAQKTVIPFEYLYLEKVADAENLYVAMKEKNYGLINASQEEILKFEYQFIDNALLNNRIVVAKDDEYYFVDEEGSNRESEVTLDYIERIKEGQDYIAKKNGLYGILSFDEGNMMDQITGFTFSDMKSISPEVSVVKENNYWFAIENATNNIIASSTGKPIKDKKSNPSEADRYTGLTIREDGSIIVDRSRIYGVLNSSGKLVLGIYYSEVNIKDEYFIVRNNNSKLYGAYFKDEEGTRITKCYYEYIDDNFYEDLLLVKKDGLYGFINKDGEIKIECKYDRATNFSKGKAEISLNDRYYYLSTTGEIIEEKN